MTDFPPPEHLSERSGRIWADVVPSRCRSPGRLLLLQTALESLDRCEQARREVGESGLTTKTETSGAIHANPAVKIEREFRGQFLSAWNQLGLGWDALLDGRTIG